MPRLCSLCHASTSLRFHSYAICESCKSKLNLLTDETIKKQSSKNSLAYETEIERRLDQIDKDHIKKKIKLLHVKDRLRRIK